MRSPVMRSTLRILAGLIGIVRTVEPILGERELRLVVQLGRKTSDS